MKTKHPFIQRKKLSSRIIESYTIPTDRHELEVTERVLFCTSKLLQERHVHHVKAVEYRPRAPSGGGDMQEANGRPTGTRTLGVLEFGLSVCLSACLPVCLSVFLFVRGPSFLSTF